MSHDYEASNVSIAWAKKDSLSAWRNGDAKLEAADVVEGDHYLNHSLFEPIGLAGQMGRADSYLNHWRTTEYAIGFYGESYQLQSGRLLYPFMGKCSTLDDLPAVNDYIHTMAARTTQTPVNQGRHLQILNDDSGENEIIDILGMLPVSYMCACSERRPKAVQSALWNCAYTKSTGVDLITEPTPATPEPFDWSEYTFPTFTYNSETLECDIMGHSFGIQNNVFWRGLDATKYYSVGKMGNYRDISVTLQIIPKGKNIKELIRTVLESYATDLDLTVKISRNTTNDYIQFVHDKMYCMPFDIIPPSRNNWFEGYLITLHQLGTGSVVPTVVDAYSDAYYEGA